MKHCNPGNSSLFPWFTCMKLIQTATVEGFDLNQNSAEPGMTAPSVCDLGCHGRGSSQGKRNPTRGTCRFSRGGSSQEYCKQTRSSCWATRGKPSGPGLNGSPQIAQQQFVVRTVYYNLMCCGQLGGHNGDRGERKHPRSSFRKCGFRKKRLI